MRTCDKCARWSYASRWRSNGVTYFYVNFRSGLVALHLQGDNVHTSGIHDGLKGAWEAGLRSLVTQL